MLTVAEAGNLAEKFDALVRGLAPNRGGRRAAVGIGLRGRRPSPHVVIQVPAGEPPPRLPDRIDGFKVWIETERVESAGYAMDRIRRAFGFRPQAAWAGWPGSCLKADGVERLATLGCYLGRSGARDRYALTCAHGMMTESGGLGGPSVRSFASRRARGWISLGKLIPVAGRPSFDLELDAALVSVDNPSRAVNVVPLIGRLAVELPAMSELPLGTMVCKYGAGSGFTAGLISGVVSIDQQRDHGSPIKLPGAIEVVPRWDDAYRFTSFCSGGDSGSIVAVQAFSTDEAPVLGLLVARGTLLQRGYVLPMEKVLSRFGLCMV